jgi:hypothetical protein
MAPHPASVHDARVRRGANAIDLGPGLPAIFRKPRPLDEI